MTLDEIYEEMSGGKLAGIEGGLKKVGTEMEERLRKDWAEELRRI
jgi:hypothetical protein